MGDPIDIKTKKIISKLITKKFDKALVLEAIEQNILSQWDTFGKFQQIWSNRAFNTFKDFDKYVVLIYLVRDYFQQLSNKFEFLSYEKFYEFEYIIINKLNLIKIAKELNIPKETLRRKVNELQEEGILVRKGKNIILQKKLVFYQKPEASLEAISNLIHKSSKILQGKDWFGDELEKEEIQIYIKKYFTILWLSFLKLQIPFLLRNRRIFKDLETWIIWGNIALNHQNNLNKILKNSVEVVKVDYKNYYKKITDLKINQGVNASSIADISNIPRATVIRKLRWLIKQQVVKKNKNLEYIMEYKGELNKKIEEAFRINQFTVSEYLTDFFDYYKNSNFKP
tara:strand:- start:160 stop:1179 length:1020 start_codon:yes stop_codon:yes gene_type:complete